MEKNPKKKAESNSLMLSQTLTELTNIQKDICSIKYELSQVLKFVSESRSSEKEFVMVKKEKELLQKEKDERWFY